MWRFLCFHMTSFCTFPHDHLRSTCISNCCPIFILRQLCHMPVQHVRQSPPSELAGCYSVSEAIQAADDRVCMCVSRGRGVFSWSEGNRRFHKTKQLCPCAGGAATEVLC